MTNRHCWVVLILTSLTLSVLGCGGASGPEKIEISGKVMHNGQPIADGTISFHPDQTSPGPPSSSPIQNGEYRLAPDWGLVPGTYQVRVEAYKAPPANESNLITPGGTLDRPPETPGVPRRDQYLPEKFNTQSTIEKLTVASGQKRIEQNYDLKD